jgi:hypothetical protein
MYGGIPGSGIDWSPSPKQYEKGDKEQCHVPCLESEGREAWQEVHGSQHYQEPGDPTENRPLE